MSFWSKSSPEKEQSSKSGAGYVEQDTPGLKEARYQIEGVTDMFNRMNDTCFEKCIGKMSDAELNIGEMSCVDRCVIKYMQAQNQIGLKLREETMAQQQQQPPAQ